MDRAVLVDEIVLVVSQALNGGASDLCLSADINQDRDITVDEILATVQTALFGCPGLASLN
jgi:hypothetical protein